MFNCAVHAYLAAKRTLRVSMAVCIASSSSKSSLYLGTEGGREGDRENKLVQR